LQRCPPRSASPCRSANVLGVAPPSFKHGRAGIKVSQS
jgi:hypothetical protein